MSSLTTSIVHATPGGSTWILPGAEMCRSV